MKVEGNLQQPMLQKEQQLKQVSNLRITDYIKVKKDNMQQPPKKGLLSPKRVMEIADSLDKKSIAKKKTAYEQRLIGNATVKNKVADNEVEVDKWGSTLSGNDKNLMDTYITPTMVWYCRAELPLVMNYKYFNKSVGVQNADNMNPASLEEIGFLMNNAKNKAEWYAERLTKYLMSNQTLFPNYLNQINSNIDTIYAKRTNYTSGMVLGGSGCCKGDYNFTGIRNAPSEYNRNEGCNNC
jgi:hypothetical protein